MNKNKLKINVILFIILILVSFYFILKGINMIEVFEIIKKTNYRYIILAVFSMFFYFVFESINIKSVLKILNHKIKFISALKYTFIGFFFSAITPASSGGQPVEAYYMKKDKIPISDAVFTLLLNLTSYQIVVIVFSIVGYIYHYDYLIFDLFKIRYIFFLGLFLNTLLLTIYIIFMVSKKTSNSIIKFIINVMKFFHVKNIESKEKELLLSLNNYQECSKIIKKNILSFVKMISVSFLQLFFFYLVPFLIYKSFGLSNNNLIEIVLLQALLYLSVSSIPLPGSVGVSEATFLLIYKRIYSSIYVNSGMLLSRWCSFYSYVIISFIIVLVSSVKKKKH